MTANEIQHVTKDIAVASSHRQEFFHKTNRNSDGSALRCRVNGRCKTWKTRPDEFELPVKYGLKECFYINQYNCSDWLIDEPTQPCGHHLSRVGKRGNCLDCPK